VITSPTPFAGLSRLHLIMGVQCNVRCTMCYQTDFSPKSNMPRELYAERLAQAYRHVTSVKLQGGEPTIMKNCREAAVLLREHPQVKLTIITNGVFIDDFWHETFVEQAGNVSVSINAASKEVYEKIVVHGEWERVIKNLERVIAARRGKTPSVGVTVVILKENFHELHRIIELCGRIGIDYVELLADPILSFAGLPARAEVEAELRRCMEAKSKTNVDVIGLDGFGAKFAIPLFGASSGEKKPMCGAPFSNLVIDWNGDVRVCCNTWVKAGNLYEKPLEAILEDRIVSTFRKKMQNDDYVWCSPNCSDNASPTKLSLAHKYAYEFREDPRYFLGKVQQKVKQIQGKWVTPKKRSKPLADPKTEADRKVRLRVLDDGN
jgi:sulfatase maturation enzyme AslB (radical SAM superfamily)